MRSHPRALDTFSIHLGTENKTRKCPLPSDTMDRTIRTATATYSATFKVKITTAIVRMHIFYHILNTKINFGSHITKVLTYVVTGAAVEPDVRFISPAPVNLPPGTRLNGFKKQVIDNIVDTVFQLSLTHFAFTVSDLFLRISARVTIILGYTSLCRAIHQCHFLIFCSGSCLGLLNYGQLRFTKSI